jgi:hypothetical protein
MCCGKNRIAISQSRTASARKGAQAAHMPAPPQHSTVAYFQYCGRTAMTVIGPVSGMRYRFPAPGSRLPVDIRDRAAVAAVLGMVQVQSP